MYPLHAQRVHNMTQNLCLSIVHLFLYEKKMDWAKGRQGKKEVDSTICRKEPIADLRSSPKDPVLMLHLLEHKLTNYNNIRLWKLHPITKKN
jgi:hypothetical protein